MSEQLPAGAVVNVPMMPTSTTLRFPPVLRLGRLHAGRFRSFSSEMEVLPELEKHELGLDMRTFIGILVLLCSMIAIGCGQNSDPMHPETRVVLYRPDGSTAESGGLLSAAGQGPLHVEFRTRRIYVKRGPFECDMTCQYLGSRRGRDRYLFQISRPVDPTSSKRVEIDFDGTPKLILSSQVTAYRWKPQSDLTRCSS